MIVGIISEGVTDQVVIRNILYSYEIDKNKIRFVRPELAKDATDGYTNMSENEFGSWTIVEQECKRRENIKWFFDNVLKEEKILIIQIDSDVCAQYDVQEVIPIDNIEQITEQRNRIILKIKDWLNNEIEGNIVYAICIRTMDAWILSLEEFNKREKETAFYANPKNKLKETGESCLRNKIQKIAYEQISQSFINKKKLAGAVGNNYSLKLFIDDFEHLFGSIPSP